MKSNLVFLLFGALVYGLWRTLEASSMPNAVSISFTFAALLSLVAWVIKRIVLFRRDDKDNKTVAEPIETLGSLAGVLVVIWIIRSFFFEPFQIPSGSMQPTLRVGDFLLVEKYAYGVKDPIFSNTLIETGKPQRGDVAVFKYPENPSQDYIKRVIGVPGDIVVYNVENHRLWVIKNKDGKPCFVQGEENCEALTFQYSEPKEAEDFFQVVGQTRSLEPQLIFGKTHPLVATESVATENEKISHEVLWDQPTNVQEMAYYKHFGAQQGYATSWVVPEGQYFMMGDNRNNSFDSRFWGFVPEKNFVGKARFIWLSLEREQNQWPTGIRFNRLFNTVE